MNYREIFQRSMNYERVDRMPVIHWTGWPETHERWYKEGYPKDCEPQEYFNGVPMWTGFGADLNLFPRFEEKTLEDTPEYRIFSDPYGVIQQDWKKTSCIPHYIDFTLKTAEDWPKFKERLQPDKRRIPENLEKDIINAANSGCPITIGTASMMGWFRNWMGVENMSYLMYDNPEVYKDMVDTVSDLVCWQFDEVLPVAKKLGVTPDMGFGWEDICGKTGPLVSPTIFEKCVAQGYRKIREKLESYDVHLLGLDSDGYIEPLLPNWLNAGVNLMFPVEPGSWGATPEKLRKRFGKDLHMIGGFDKLKLEKGPEAIDAEIEAHIDLLIEGGFIMMPDHLITPDTSLENYKYYLEKIRELRF